MKTLFQKSMFLLILCLTSAIQAISATGNLAVKAGETRVAITGSSYQQLSMKSSVSEISYLQVNTGQGAFTNLQVRKFGNRNIEGEPALPVYHQLIEVPLGSGFNIQITRQHFIDIDLTQKGITNPVFPAQPPMSKGDDPNKVPFIYNQASYSLNQFTNDPLVTVTPVGLMRSLNLARIDISPVQYNPVTNTLRVYDELEFKVIFVNGDISGTIALKQSKSSQYFNSMYDMVENYQTPPSDELLSAPATYVIISDPMFQTILQPFVLWRRDLKLLKATQITQVWEQLPPPSKPTCKVFTIHLHQVIRPQVLFCLLVM